VPQVVVYKTSSISYRIAKMLIKVPFISLVNLVAQKEVVKEFIQHEASADNVATELTRILNDENHRAEISNGYNQIINLLDTGSASENTAKLMIKYLGH
jgi:lipid-A-disaccharide synthase